MGNTLTKREATIKFLIPSEKVVVFDDSDKYYDLADVVASFDFTKVGIGKGSKVEVSIDSSAGEHGTVVFMKKATGASEPEKKSEPKSEGSSNKKILTVAGIAFKTKGIIFEEEEKVWYTVADNIGIGNLKKYGIEKGVKVEVSIEAPEQEGKNSTVVFIKKASDSNSGTASGYNKSSNYSKGNYSKGKYNNSTQDSIEAQAAVNAACDLVGTMINGQSVETILNRKKEILALREEVARDNYRIVQELKKNQA